jgi:hypothetical protein
MAYQNRNFVIAYLHLVLLGFISLFAFAKTVKTNPWTTYGILFFLFSFVTTETLMVLNASSGILRFHLPYTAQLLLVCSLFFPVGVAFLMIGFRGQRPVLLPRKMQRQKTVSIPVA